MAGGEKRTRIEPRGLCGASIAILRDRSSVAREIGDLDEAANGAARVGIGEQALHRPRASQMQIDACLVWIAVRDQ